MPKIAPGKKDLISPRKEHAKRVVEKQYSKEVKKEHAIKELEKGHVVKGCGKYGSVRKGGNHSGDKNPFERGGFEACGAPRLGGAQALTLRFHHGDPHILALYFQRSRFK